MINKIVFTTDLLRLQDDQYFSQHVLKWAYPLMQEQISIASGSEIKMISNDDKEFFDADKFYKLCNYDVTTENWVNIYCKKITQEAKDYFYSCFKDCFVITQEAGAMRYLFEEFNIPYLDFYVSAIRFCSDLFFAYRSNVKEIREVLKKYRIPEEQFYIEASSLKAHYNKSKEIKTNSENILLLCGQTGVDLSLIKDGRLVNFINYKREIETLFDEYDEIYYKPHPYANPKSENELFIRRHPAVKVVNINVYKLLSQKNIKGVAALSSGILQEAKYFRKKVHTISHEYVTYWNNDKILDSNSFITTVNEYRNPAFWADILQCVLPRVNKIDIKILQEPNYLRKLFSFWWGYEFSNYESKINVLKNRQVKNFEDLYTMIINRTRMFRDVRKIISLVVPFKSLRKKIRGDFK